MVYPYFDERKPYVPIGDNATPEEGWQPSLSQDQVKQFINLYKKSPTSITPQKLDEIQKHAVQYNIPFYTGDFNIVDAFKEFGKGVLAGFTTFDPFDHPDNEYEAIARNVGHLVGFAPGVAAGPLKMLRAHSLAKAAAAMGPYSVPMIGANWLTKKAKNIVKPALDTAIKGRADAAGVASKFLTSARIGKAKHVAEGAFHLGAASAISSWQQGIDAMVQSAFGGAIAGGVFRGIGNLVNTGDKTADTAIRTISGSLFQGLPATMRGATTPEQVYEYLLGGYFGGKEMPWYKAKAQKKLVEMRKQAQTDPAMKKEMAPERLKDWGELEPEVQKELTDIASKTFGTPEQRLAVINSVLEQMGMINKDTGEPTPEGFKVVNKLVRGMEVVKLDEPNIVLHHGISGGRSGGDALFTQIGKEFNVPFVRYTFRGDAPKGTGLKRSLTEAELAESNQNIKKANETLDRLKEIEKLPRIQYNYALKRLQRDSWKVKTSNAIYAVGKIRKGGTEVEGETGWTVQMGIDAKKRKVYTWDTGTKKWHRYDYGLGKFRMIDKTPTMDKRPLGVGSRFVKKGSPAEKAIRDLFEVTFKERTPKKTKAKDAVSEKEIKTFSRESLKEYKELTDKIGKLESDFEVHTSDANNKNLSKSARLAARKEAQKTMQELQPLKDNLENFEQRIKTVAEQEAEPMPTEDGNDIGMIPAREIEKKSVSFVTQFLKPLWNLQGYGPSVKHIKKAQYASLLQSIIRKSKYSGKGAKIDEEGIAKEFETYLYEKEGLSAKQSKISNEGKRKLRQWLNLRNFGRQVKFVRVDDTGIYITKDGEYHTRAGTKKLLNESKKPIEDVYEEYDIALNKKPSKDPVFAILDSITTGEKGFYTDVDLSRYRDQRRSEGDIEGYRKEIGEIVSKLGEKGYYPLGGKSDADAIYFVKYHPLIAGNKKRTDSLYSLFKRALDPGELAILESSDKTFKKQYGFSTDKEMLLSNLLYDIDLNGMSPFLRGGNTRKEWRDAIRNLLNKNDDFHTIKSATAWNKRQQIWFTPGFKGDPAYVKDYLAKVKKAEDLVINDNGDLSFRYILAKDVPEPLKRALRLDDPNSKDETSVDGMTTVRDDVIDAINKDAGMHESSGQNKNFIVSPNAKKGALLGKHMMHSAGPELSKAMRKEGIHMIIQDSAAKQRGGRQLTTYKKNPDGSLNIENPEYIYRLPVKDVRYNYSVVQGPELLDPKRIPKQVISHMTENTHVPFDSGIIKDFIKNTVEKRYEGDPEVNRRADRYMDNPNDVDAEFLVKNIEGLGIARLLQAIKKGTPEFVDLAYARMMKFNREMIRDLLSSGEMTSAEFERMENDLIEFDAPADRMIKEGSNWAKSERANGRPGDINPLFLHKDIRGYRLQVMKNYIVDTISKPTIKNSTLARMRGYDEWFKTDKRFKELETRDDIFYLDDGYRDLNIFTHIKGLEKTTLGKLWDMYTNKDKKNKWYQDKRIKEVLRAATVRVPMDATSGMQIMNFRGFTGRKGHGILMHARAMKAEGGADLDGDESFIFFGGRKGNRGSGWKRTWKDGFEANKEEFYEKKPGKPTSIYENKTPETRKNLTLQDSEDFSGINPNNRDSAVWKYHPAWRVMISERARDGRNQLGDTVIMTQLMKQFHNEIRKSSDSFMHTTFSPFEPPKNWSWVITPKKNIEKARKLSSSMIAFSSDPMDEAGLKSSDVWFRKLFDSYFDVTVNGNKVKLSDPSYKELLPYNPIGAIKFNSKYKYFSAINKGLYSRNWGENRSFNLQEVKDLTGASAFLNDNGTLSKIGRIANMVDYNDSVLSRVDFEGLLGKNGQYSIHKKFVEDNPYLAKVLERSSIEVTPDNYVKNVLENNLQYNYVRDLIASEYMPFVHAIKGTKFSKMLEKGELEKDNPQNIKRRLAILNEMISKAEDFIVNDVTDMISFELISKYAKNVDAEKVTEIHKFADDIKRNSWLQRKQRNAFNRMLNKVDKTRLKDDKVQKFMEDLRAEWAKQHGEESAEKHIKMPKAKTVSEEISALKDLITINNEIKAYKKTLNANEAKLLDMMILGSSRRGKTKRIDMLEKKWGKVLKTDKLYRDLLHHLRLESSKTGTSMLGFNAEAVNGASVREFIGEYSKRMRKSWEKPEDINFEKDVEKIEKLEKDSFMEAEIDVNIEGETLPEVLSGFEGLTGSPDAKVKLTKKHKQIISELVNNLKFYNNKMGVELNEITRGILEKDLNVMNIEDFADLNNYFKETRNGTIWQRLFREKTPDMRYRYHLQFPETVNREMMKYDIMFLKQRGQFLTKEGVFKEGDIRKPTNIIEATQNVLGRLVDMGNEESEKHIGQLRNNLVFLENIPEGESFRRVAVMESQLNEINRVSAREDISNARKAIIKENYEKRYEKILNEANYEELQDKKYYVRLPETPKETTELTGREVVNKVKEVYKKHFDTMYETIDGTKEGKKKFEKYVIGHFDKVKKEPRVDYLRFIKDVQDAFHRGEGIPMDIGLTNLRRIAKSMMVDLAPKGVREAILAREIEPVGKIMEGYWPHMMHNKSDAMKSLKKAYEMVKNDPDLSREEMKVELQKILMKSKSITGDWTTGTEDWKIYDELGAELKAKQLKKKETVSWPDANQVTGNMKSRDVHIPGFSIDAQVAEIYTRNQINTYYKQLSQIMSRHLMHKFNQKGKKLGWDKIKDYGDKTSLLERWQNFLQLYIQDAMGNPSVVPQKMIDDPKMRLKGNPYAWWADNKVREKADKIAKKLGLRGKDLLTVKHDLERVDYMDLKNWSNMEAKFELMSLLAHPKSAVANIFGGSLHTIQSTGLEYFRKARNISELQKINPLWKSLQDVHNFVVEKGVLPEFIQNELGLSREAQTANGKAFIRDITKRLTNDPNIDKATIRELGRRHRIGERFMNLAAQFMSKPEMVLRRDAFMAHYIKAWERFGGTIKNPDHPFLIEMAKKGVKATQFLYNAPYRPAFARTALGKIMTRFQLWSWNAVKFRNDVLREARIKGFKQGTAEFERFKRTMQVDLFVLALANVFAYSLFDSALPAPYNYLKDTAEWVFGDEESRNKSFFGTWPAAVAPLQMVTPPVARLPVAGLRAFLDDDYGKLANYYIYTMFPFGRIARDISPLASGNLIDNPHRILEKTTGFPLGDVTKLRKQIRKKELYYPRSFEGNED